MFRRSPPSRARRNIIYVEVILRHPHPSFCPVSFDNDFGHGTTGTRLRRALSRTIACELRFACTGDICTPYSAVSCLLRTKLDALADHGVGAAWRLPW